MSKGNGGHRPSLATRLAAVLHGEVAADTVEAYRRAGAVAYEHFEAAERLRAQLASTGTDVWSAPPGQRTLLLCAWNAFVLQTLGEQLIDADYQADPSTVGYLPRVTADQAATFLGEVEWWASRARRAAADDQYDIALEQTVPAPLPNWVEVEPCPRAHLDAMLATARSVRDRAQAALADLMRAQPAAVRQRDVSVLKGLLADADGALAYAEPMWAPRVNALVHQRVEASLKRAIEGYYRAGQLMAMPALLHSATAPRTTLPSGPRLPLPGQPGFDPWCLTDPESRPRWQQDPRARRAIETMWAYDPDPATTLDLQRDIAAALEAGALGPARDHGTPLGSYYCCPWSSIYQVRSQVTVGGQRFRPGEQFTLDVSAEEVREGGQFERRVVRGPFHASSQVDYCD